MRKFNHFIVLAIFVFISACSSDLSQEKRRWEKHAENVTIYRDNYGVPHIYGKTDADAVFGLLYAQCEDDFKRVERNYVWAIGRLAEIEGENALYSDLRARLFMSKEEAVKKYENSPEWLKELCVAFADGINYYLHTHPEVKPELLTRFEPWMPMYFSEGSIGGDIERVSVKKIKGFYENEEIAYNDASVNKAQQELYKEPQGSNGFAVSGKLTKSGNAMLLINPHTSFYFRGEVHVVSEEGLNAYGAVTWGQFFIYQGFNEKTGWMHTSTYTDVMDEYLIDVQKDGAKLVYNFDEEQKEIEVDRVELKYKSGDQVLTKVFPVFKTIHGPVTGKVDDKWIATSMLWDPVNALAQSYIRTKQDGLEGFHKMMEYRTNSSNNTVYADADGNIAYYHGNFIPVRNENYDYTKPVNGNTSETFWKGKHKVDECIYLHNPSNGWIQNCNSTPYTSAGENSPKRGDFPKYMSVDIENFRGVHAIDLLSKADDLTIESMIDLAYDPFLPAFEALIPGLIKAYDANPIKSKPYKNAIDELRNWDYRVSEESIAMSLAHFYGMLYNKYGKAPNGLTRMERLTYFGTKSSYKERLDILTKVVEKLTSDFGTWQVQWGEINRFQRINGNIKTEFVDSIKSYPVGLASGRWGALASYGAVYGEDTKRIYGRHGNSFVAVVEFGDKVKAKSLLAGGQSGDPKSPHFDDQVDLYLKGEFKDVFYYKEDVLKVAKIKYHPGE